MVRRTALLALFALLLPAVGVAEERAATGWFGGLAFAIGARDSVGVLWHSSPGARQFPPTRREVLAASDTVLRTLAASGVRLPVVRVRARITRSGLYGLSYTRPFDVEPSEYPWVVRLALTPAPTVDGAPRERLAEFVVLGVRCGAGDIEVMLGPGMAGIDVFRPLAGGLGLVCEDRDEGGAYRVAEQPGSREEGGGHCGWSFDLPGGPPTAAEGDDPGSPAAPPVPLAELLASGRPVFEALASVQRTSCGDLPSP